MKRWYGFVLGVLIVLVLAGCATKVEKAAAEVVQPLVIGAEVPGQSGSIRRSPPRYAYESGYGKMSDKQTSIKGDRGAKNKIAGGSARVSRGGGLSQRCRKRR